RARAVLARRREPCPDRGRARAVAVGARLGVQPPAGRTRRRAGDHRIARALLPPAARPRGSPAVRRSGADAGEDAEERAAHPVPAGGVPAGALRVPVPRAAPGAGQHDRRLALGAVPDLSAPARLGWPGVVVPADPGLAPAGRATAGGN